MCWLGDESSGERFRDSQRLQGAAMPASDARPEVRCEARMLVTVDLPPDVASGELRTLDGGCRQLRRRGSAEAAECWKVT